MNGCQFHQLHFFEALILVENMPGESRNRFPGQVDYYVGGLKGRHLVSNTRQYPEVDFPKSATDSTLGQATKESSGHPLENKQEFYFFENKQINKNNKK